MMGLLILVGAVSLVWFVFLIFMSFFHEHKASKNFTTTLQRFERFGVEKQGVVRSVFHKAAWAAV
jgi:hypothetical protein